MFFLPKKKNTLLLTFLVNIARKYFVTVKKTHAQLGKMFDEGMSAFGACLPGHELSGTNFKGIPFKRLRQRLQGITACNSL